MNLRHLGRWATALALGASTMVAVASPATAKPDGSAVVINEIYPNGGSANGAYKQRYFELFNPTTQPVSVNGWSLQGRSATGTGSFNTKTDLGDKTIDPGGYLLISGPGPSPATGVKDLPTPDVAGTQVNVSASGGQVALSKSTTLLTGDRATLLANTDLVDLVGYGSSTTSYEGTGPAPLGSAANGIARNATHVDTDDNATNFTAQAASPCNSAGCPAAPPPDPEPITATIRQIQGTGPATTIAANQRVITRGVVTAAYKVGGFNGGYIQTPGTGGPTDPSARTGSDGLFVFGSAFAAGVSVGDHVEVRGLVSEFNGMTQVVPSASNGFEVLSEPAAAVTPSQVSFPLSEASKEKLEGMLVAPQGTFTITDNYATNQYAEIGLAPGDEPLPTPTNVVAPGDAAKAKAAENAARKITLDDAASINFFAPASQGTPVPWLSDQEVRVGQKLTFDAPVILDYRNSAWKLQPLQQVVAGGADPVQFGPSTRAAGPEPVGGTVKIGTFNVLNYFPTVAEEWDALPGNICTYYTDRAGANITANNCGNPAATTGNGPRGAATQTSFERQQAKIVTAIEKLDADVVSLEEIENSVKFGLDRDDAVAQLVAALNAASAPGTWAYTDSPEVLPDVADQDLIRSAFIYQTARVQPVGDGQVLTGSAAFGNAREPYAHTFKPVGGASDSAFAVIVNHFKSKGSGTGVGDEDTGDGQGASNGSRTRQAAALVDFASTFAAAAGTDKVFLTGDFNAYNKEDPVRIIEDAGYVNVPAELTDKETYQFDGQVGSLDHVFASDAVFGDVTGADIWNINSYESVAREYSRFNYNVSPLVDTTSPFRASDHDPELVGVDLPLQGDATLTASAPGTIRSGQDLPVTASVPGGTGTVTVSEDGEQLATGTLTDGTVTLAVEGLVLGSHTLDVAYGGDGDLKPATTRVATKVIKAKADLAATVESSQYGSASLEVTGDPTASGPLFVFDEDGNGVGMGRLVDGAATVALDRTLAVGDHTLTVAYTGSAGTDPDDTEVDLTVVRATPVVTRTVVTSKIVVGTTKANAYLTVKAPGYVVDGGSLQIFQGSNRLGFGTVSDGSVKVPLKVFTSTGTKTLTAKYFGTAVTAPAQTTFTVKVVSR